MIRAKIYATVGMAIFCLCLSCSPKASEAETAEAVTAAQNWLALIDEGEYGESWEEAAVYFKNALSKKMGTNADCCQKAIGTADL